MANGRVDGPKSYPRQVQVLTNQNRALRFNLVVPDSLPLPKIATACTAILKRKKTT